MNAMSGTSGEGSVLTPLWASDYDLTNMTQAMDFLTQMLDDGILQYDGKAYSQNFWYGAIAVIGLVPLYNLLFRLALNQRQRATAAGRSNSAAATSFPARVWTVVLGLVRKITYPQFTPARAYSLIQIPPIGTIILILSYLGFILALEFVNNNVLGAQYYTALGVRAGWLAVAQTPLLILLAGKNNLIGLVTGVTYERLNILHRWVARGFLLLATIHFAVQNIGWNKFGLRKMEWDTDTCPPTGIAAYALLLWLNLSTLAPFRNFSYEFFVLQHLITFFGFIVAIMYHLPSTAYYTRVYIWIPIGLYLLDRVLRTARSIWHNARPSRAVLQAVDGTVTRVRISNSRIKNWSPGSHVLLSIPRYGVGQSHPATIFSTPTSHNGDLLVLLRARGGFTKRLASNANISVESFDQSPSAEKVTPHETHRAIIDGPYGGCQADFASYETVLLLAGSTGITFALSILLDLAGRVEARKLPVRKLDLVWCVKSAIHSNCVSAEMEAAFGRLQRAGIEARLRLFVTCNNKFSSSTSSLPKPESCQWNSSVGQACCCLVESPPYEVIPLDGGHSSRGSASDATLDGRLDCATTESGRPDIRGILVELMNKAEGEMGVAVCGPLGMNTATRRAVAKLQGQKWDRQGIYLHVEGFGW